MERSRTVVLLVLFGGVAAVSTAAILVRAAAAPPLSIAALRLGIASLPALAFLRVRVLRRRDTDLSRWDGATWRWALCSGACLALHFATWIASLELTTVASSVVLVTTSPLFVAVFVALRGEDVAPGTWAAIAVCVLGGALIGGADLHRGNGALAGDALALAGAVFAAAYFAIGRRLRRHSSLASYIGVVYPVAALLLLGVVLITRQPLVGFNGQTYLMVALMALVPQLIGHSSLNWALGFLSAPFVAIAVLGEPIVSTLLAAVLLAEFPGPLRIAGGATLLAGVYLGLRAELRSGSSALPQVDPNELLLPE